MTSCFFVAALFKGRARQRKDVSGKAIGATEDFIIDKRAGTLFSPALQALFGLIQSLFHFHRLDGERFGKFSQGHVGMEDVPSLKISAFGDAVIVAKKLKLLSFQHLLNLLNCPGIVEPLLSFEIGIFCREKSPFPAAQMREEIIKRLAHA